MAERIVQQPVATAVQEKFSNLPSADVQRSTFDMSHPWKGTCETDQIVPTLVMEILPGDTFNIQTTAFMRLATPLKPIMDSLTTDIHYFFVPNRLVWDNWQQFMGERKDPDDDPTELSIPQHIAQLQLPEAEGTLYDYMGLPMIDPAGNPDVKISVNALPFRGYNLIWNEWYRNQNLIQEFRVPTDDGPDDPEEDPFNWLTKARHKRADYFTRALPWPQKGDPVYLPLGEFADVKGGKLGDPSQNLPSFEADNFATPTVFGLKSGGDVDGVKTMNIDHGDTGDANLRWEDPQLYADLTQATAATINDIRTAFQVQKLLERDARGGTRYIEIILSHFNVQSPDMRLQRPEYLGGGSQRIIVNPVAATVATDDAPQGNLAAVGTGLVKGGCNHSFTEHGYIFCLLSSRQDLTYQNGLDRSWSRRTRYDYYWPALSHLGEQAIKNKELYFTVGELELNEETWGFQERFAEYRYQPGRVTGLFRSEHPESLDVWHLAQDFQELPLLDANFVYENPPIDRVVAVPSEPDLIVDIWHKIQATRPMPVYAVPGLVDHF